ncbi:MAG TPA: hypothetical protein VFB32_05920 [Rudaea sp.]|nr:hypothetical protein [Rudaea sp.]
MQPDEPQQNPGTGDHPDLDCDGDPREPGKSHCKKDAPRSAGSDVRDRGPDTGGGKLRPSDR